MLKQACPEGMLKQMQHDTFRVQHDISGRAKGFSEISEKIGG
jgi:hypothetical protein